MIKSLVMIKLFTWSLLPSLCAQVVLPSVPSTPSGRGSQENYQIGSEVGYLFMDADGSLDWVLRAVPGVLASKVESQAPFDVGYSVARFGNSRRFLISGYDSQGGIGRIALVELCVSPQSIQLLSVADYQGEPTTLTHNSQSSELFVYNFAVLLKQM